MANDRGTASRVHGTLPESLWHQQAEFIKPLIKPLISSLYTTFVQDLNERDPIENVSLTLNKRQYLPVEARGLLVQQITKFVDTYLDNHTYDGIGYNSNAYSIMNRFMNEHPKDAPWIGLTPKDNHEDDMRATTSKNLLQVAKGVGGYNWETDLGMSMTESTREQTGNAVLEQRVETAQRIITQGGSGFLDPKRAFHQKAMSTTGVMEQNVHADDVKSRGCTSYIDGSTSKPQSKRRRNDPSLGNNSKGLSTAATGTPSGVPSVSAGSIKSNRREPKKHKCPDCDDVFQFEARLKSHQAVHSKTKFKCLNCDSLFGRDSSLKRHQTTAGACQKKKEAKLRNASFQNSSAGTRSGSQQNFYDVDATASTSSLVDGTSVNSSPLDTRHPPQSFSHPYQCFNIPPSPGSNAANYGSGYQSLNQHQRPSGNVWSTMDPTPIFDWDPNNFIFSD